MTNEIMNDVVETVDQETMPAEVDETCDEVNVPALVGATLLSVVVFPFAAAFSAFAGANAALEYFSEDAKEARKAKKEARQKKRAERKLNKELKKQKKPIIVDDDVNVEDINVTIE